MPFNLDAIWGSGGSSGPSNDFADPTGGSQSPFDTSGAGGGGLFSNLTGKQELGLAGAGLGAGALAYDLFKGNQTDPNVQNLQGLATQFGNQGNALFQQGHGLQSYLTQGTLPPALQAQNELASESAKARIVQQQANTGMNPNATQNSALTQDLNTVDLLSQEQAFKEQQGLFQFGTDLTNQGIKLSGMDAELYGKLAAIDQQQQTDVTNAIMGFAKSLGSLAPLFAA